MSINKHRETTEIALTKSKYPQMYIKYMHTKGKSLN